jgi:hypothetical protein
MAQQVSVQYVDDLDGSAASGPVDFSLDGKGYTIDLSDANVAKLHEVLAPFLSAARRASGSARQSPGTSTHSGRPRLRRNETPEVRAWLRDNGYAVKDRGRVPMDLIAAYETRTAATNRSAAPKSRKRRKVNNVEFSGGETE